MVVPLICAPVYSSAQEEDLEVEMGRSSPESDDLVVESTPVKPHENVYIEDVEAQLQEAKEEARAAQKEVQRSEERLKKVRAKNYGDKKHLQKETIKALERKKAADQQRAKIEKQREKLQSDILAYEKKRARAKSKADKSVDSIEQAKNRLIDAKQERMAMGQGKPVPETSKKRHRKVKIDFGENPKTLASESK